MRMHRLLRTVLVAFGLVALLVVPVRAEFFFEGQIWGEEFEDGPAELRQLELFQNITERRFEAYEEVNLLFQLELGNMPAIQGGVARIRAKVFKADGSTIKLPMMSARVQEGTGLVQRTAEVTLERGDIIRWRVRFRGLPTMSQDGACQIVVGVSSRAMLE